MPRLPLNTLTAFRAVAELQNLRAAAEVLHLTHSAVSQQIRGLEEQLGFALFDRRGRRVVLNPAGQALLRSVQSRAREARRRRAGGRGGGGRRGAAAARHRAAVVREPMAAAAHRPLARAASGAPARDRRVDARRRPRTRRLPRGRPPGHRPVGGTRVRTPVRAAVVHRRRLAFRGAPARGRATRGARARAAAGRQRRRGRIGLRPRGCG